MYRKKIVALAFALAFSLLLGSCKPTPNTSSEVTGSSTEVSGTFDYSTLQENPAPRTNGTFIQSWLCSGWTDERWEKELTLYQQLGMKYIILGDVATRDKGQWSSYYPSNIDDLKNGTVYSTVMFDNALRNCQKFGMKVFVGVGLDTDFWDNIKNFDWMKTTMERCNEITTELYSLYYAKYPDTFYGWYWPYEIWNDSGYAKSNPDREKNIKTLADSMSIVMDHLTSLNPNMPMLWSPFVNPSYTGAEDNYAFWRDVIKEGNFRAGDIICPMDCSNNFNYTLDGKAGCDIPYIDKWDLSYRRAVDDSGKGVKFWVNCEDFASNVDPAEPASWARYVRQMQIASKYTDTIVTFAYAHYYSPYVVNKYFNDTYLDYLKNGKLETVPPSTPTNFKMKMENNVAVFSWDPCTDNFGVAGYYVYRDGEVVEHIYTQLNVTDAPIPTDASDWDVETYIAQKGKATYEVLAYDSAGNYSEKASLTVTQDDLKK